MRTAEVKRRFLGYFEANGHIVVPSAPLPFEDPNLLFVNAGMVQFVPYFTGQLAAPWKRATSIQKCIRTQDIEEVGKTTRHGTFFQMNGNFSFGDYFKQGAIELAWDLSTKSVGDGGFGLEAERIWPTVYLEDDEAFDIWHKVIGVPVERIVRRGREDNTWDMGIPGPAGTCSELFYDRGAEYGPDGGPAVDEDRYLEYWNLVFMQYERGASTGPRKGDYEILGDLPSKNIDTGLGMERIATILQGVDNLYEIDETKPILDLAAQLTGKRYGEHSGHAASQSHPDDVRLRVIADHVRSGLMLIGDGVTPSNEGRGYVLRRILRRAVRAMRLLGYGDPALPQLLPAARDCMAPSYPELASDFERISTYAYAEEEAFLHTLRSGTSIFDVAVSDARAAGATQLSGEKAFQLHDTYGFPIEITLEMAAEQGISVDEDGFRRLMAEQRRRGKEDAQGKKIGHGDLAGYRAALASGPSEFTGYREVMREARVTALVGEGGLLDGAGEGDEVELILDATPFYAEGGGQQPDWGRITVNAAGHEAELDVVERPGAGTGRRGPTGRGVAQPLGYTPAARRAAPLSRRDRVAGGVAERAGAATVRLQHPVGGAAERPGRRRGRDQRGAAARPRGAVVRHRPDRGQAHRRDRHVRREVRRQGASRRDRRLLARAVRRHARAAQLGHRHGEVAQRGVDRFGRAARRSARRVGRVPLPRSRARPGKPARR